MDIILNEYVTSTIISALDDQRMNAEVSDVSGIVKPVTLFFKSRTELDSYANMVVLGKH